MWSNIQEVVDIAFRFKLRYQAWEFESHFSFDHVIGAYLHSQQHSKGISMISLRKRMSHMPFRRDLIAICYFAYKLLRKGLTYKLKTGWHTTGPKTTRERNGWIPIIVKRNSKTLETRAPHTIHRAIVDAIVYFVGEIYGGGTYHDINFTESFGN